MNKLSYNGHSFSEEFDDCLRFQPCSPQFTKTFLNDLEILLQKGSHDVYRWLYHPYATPDSPSGMDLWKKIVETGHSQKYMLPQIEANLVKTHQRFLKNTFSHLRPFGVMAGAGTLWAVQNKEIPVLEAINACGAADWDLCSRMGREATECIEKQLDIMAVHLMKDFAEPVDELRVWAGNAPIFMTMFGCTLGNDIDLRYVPQNFARVVNRKGFFLVTIDSSRDEAAVAGYQCPLFTKFENNYWTLAKYITGDESFDDSAIQCRPYYTEENRANAPTKHFRGVVLRHVVIRDTSLQVGNVRYLLKKGMEFNTGESQKYEPEDIRGIFSEAGWDELAVLREGTVSAVLYAGKDTPKEWLSSMQ